MSLLTDNSLSIGWIQAGTVGILYHNIYDIKDNYIDVT